MVCFVPGESKRVLADIYGVSLQELACGVHHRGHQFPCPGRFVLYQLESATRHIRNLLRLVVHDLWLNDRPGVTRLGLDHGPATLADILDLLASFSPNGLRELPDSGDLVPGHTPAHSSEELYSLVKGAEEFLGIGF